MFQARAFLRTALLTWSRLMHSDKRVCGTLLVVEELESRTVPSVSATIPLAHPDLSAIPLAALVTPSAATAPAAPYTPGQMQKAYGFNKLTSPSGQVLTGAGQTIAIVDAFDDPKIVSDLQYFDSTFGLPAPPKFQKVSQTGVDLLAKPSAAPRSDAGWSSEIALDVEWAHAIAPGANILLVEANSDSFSDLLAAVDYAASKANIVSMSWGADEFSAETTAAYDGHFAGAPGVTFIAASGDSGAPPQWPAVAPNVLAVGGTTLNAGAGGNYVSETGWGSVSGGSSGGGISKFENQPAYQKGVVTQSSTRRTSPDVSYNADPKTGVYVYDSVNGAWFASGGTSAGAPQWAALIAIANQDRASHGMGVLGNQVLTDVYKLAASDFHDVTSGNNGFSAGPGYDLVTGRGSPIANLVVADLLKLPGAVTTTQSVAGGSKATGTSKKAALSSETTLTNEASWVLLPPTALGRVSNQEDAKAASAVPRRSVTDLDLWSNTPARFESSLDAAAKALSGRRDLDASERTDRVFAGWSDMSLQQWELTLPV